MPAIFTAAPALDKVTYERIRDIVYARSGITLNDEKATLVSTRLSSRIREYGLASYREYLEQLEADTSGQEMTYLLDAISTNLTYFYREEDHFEFIQKRMAAWRAAGQKRFRIWSAAASTGEEPYTLALSLDDQITPDLDFRILATDISTKVLAIAMRGVYSERDVEPIPATLRATHLVRVDNMGQPAYEVSARIKENIVYRQLNLVDLPLPLKGPLDLILCRNVMIYFDLKTRTTLVNNFYRLLRPGGILIISLSESLVGIDVPVKTLQPSVYEKHGQAQGANNE